MRVVSVSGFYGNSFGFKDNADAALFYSLLEKAVGVDTTWINNVNTAIIQCSITPSMVTIPSITKEEYEEIRKVKEEG
jgi:vacuolar-type H+-ATPase subunit F/Vma7